MSPKEVKFLVVDDDFDARSTIVEILKSHDIQSIVECVNGVEALKVIESQAIDFVISDWEMPEMDGLELIKKIRSHSQFKDLPIMMITSPVRNENLKIEDAAQNGVDAYLNKPFRSRMLMQKINEVLFNRAQRKKKAVVLADDDDMVRAFVAEVLKEMEFDPVFQFNKATDAYHFLEKNHERVALIVSDWEMPEMTGLEFLHKVRVNQKMSEMPFIIITSQTSVEHLKLQKAIQAEVDNYLMKPFNVETLKTKVKLVMAKVKLEVMIKRTLENAKASIDESDWSDAEKYLLQVKGLDPNNVDAILGLASVELNREEVKGFEKAVHYYRMAMSINAKYDRPHIELALAYEKAMSLDKATTCLRDALAVCFPQDQVFYQLGRILIRRGKNSEGINFLEKALELNPNLIEAKELLEHTPKEK